MNLGVDVWRSMHACREVLVVREKKITLIYVDCLIPLRPPPTLPFAPAFEYIYESCLVWGSIKLSYFEILEVSCYTFSGFMLT